MADLSKLLAELGGDNPQNRAIAEGLQKQGIASTQDIGVKKVPVPGYFEGTDEAAHWVPETTENAYFNKKDNSEINPTRLGVYQVDKNGKAQGDIFFHLNADDKGNVSFAPQWSPRAHGFLRDNAVGQAIMAIGKILPVTSPYFLAASAADAAAHGNYGAAIANLVPMGIQQLVAGTDVLSQLGGENFTPTAATPGGKIAEALGVPAQVADQVGKAGMAAVKAGLSGQDAGEAVLKSGVMSLVGNGADYLKSLGSDILGDVKAGITTLFGNSAEDATEGMPGAESAITYVARPPDAGETDFNYENQAGVNTGASFQGEGFGNIGEGEFDDEIKAPVDLTARDNIEPEQGINGIGEDLAVDTRADENGLGEDLAVDTRADENGIGSLNNEDIANNPFKAVDDGGIAGLDSEYKLDGAGPDYVSPPSEGDIDGTMVDDAGYVDDTSTPLDKVTVRPGWTSWEGDDNEPDWNSWEGGDNPPSDDLVVDTRADENGLGDDLVVDTRADENGLGDDLVVDTRADENGLGDDLVVDTRVDENGLGDDLVVDTRADENGLGDDLVEPTDEPVEPPPEPYKGPDDTGFLPKVPAIFPPKPKTPVLTPVTPKVDDTKPDDTGLGGIATTLLGGTSVGSTSVGGTSIDPLTGKYTFSWNKQPIKGPEKGVAYGQKYYGQHWNVSHPVDQPVEQPVKQPENVEAPIQYAEGGLMALDKTLESPTFRPTMGDGGIHAEDLTKKDVAGQALQHLRRGGHLIDHKTHKDVHYLASKGEPVHHIVGFMKHRMAKGGVTSLGSYSDGGHLLKGPGDGMSDDIPATIADKQPARLANEEFVIPADVVSHLGNGSSESGAKVLYEMMSRVRKARTGNPKQGKQIDPHKLLPKV